MNFAGAIILLFAGGALVLAVEILRIILRNNPGVLSEFSWLNAPDTRKLKNEASCFTAKTA